MAPGYFRMALDIGPAAKKAAPGQFFNVRCGNGPDPLLRRPFGLHRVKPGGEIEILYKVVGKATEILMRKKKGEALDIIGPLGNGFPLPTPGVGSAVLVAGGHGVAPLVALAETIARGTVLIGARTKNEVLCEKDFKKLGFEVLVATEDGSKGKKGLVTSALRSFLRMTNDERRTTIYACGPNAMLREIAKIAKASKAKAFGSFEEHLACGVGSCYGCVIKTKNGYRRICKDGPVFDLEEITW